MVRIYWLLRHICWNKKKKKNDAQNDSIQGSHRSFNTSHSYYRWENWTSEETSVFGGHIEVKYSNGSELGSLSCTFAIWYNKMPFSKMKVEFSGSFLDFFFLTFWCLGIFTGRTDAETEAQILWPLDAKSRLIEKDPDGGKDWRWEEKEMDEMVGWHH